MKKLYWEILGSALFVSAATIFTYGRLSGLPIFWDSQFLWSVLLAMGWVIVALGYYHQGHMVHVNKSAANVSIVLPIAVFIVQCVLFIKGIFYNDWSLITGAVMVNSGVIFNLYQIIKVRYKK